MEAIIVLILLSLVTWYVADSLKARETGVAAARDICQKEGVQFLDDSVAQRHIHFVRGWNGRLVIQRTFAFEYSDTGDNRRPGYVTLQGQDVTIVDTGLQQPDERQETTRQMDQIG